MAQQQLHVEHGGLQQLRTALGQHVLEKSLAGLHLTLLLQQRRLQQQRRHALREEGRETALDDLQRVGGSTCNVLRVREEIQIEY